MTTLKLNLGCGEKRIPGYINVDKYGSPDIKHDLESFPWPWETNSVSEILLIHVLEHLGKDVEIYFGIFKEMYRICTHGAKIKIIVPHFRHQFFYDDPTHVRVVTPLGLQLFSQKLNNIVATNLNYQLNEYPSGFYYLSVKSSLGSTTKRLLITE